MNLKKEITNLKYHKILPPKYNESNNKSIYV